jgi:preprotein translocase subunit SecF
MSGLMGRLYRNETNVDFIGKRRIWFAISLLALLISFGALARSHSEATRCGSFFPLRGLSCGIEFKGGVQVLAPIGADSPLADQDDIEAISTMRDALAEFEGGEAQIQIAGEGDERSIVVQTKVIADPAEQQAFSEAVANAAGAEVTETDVQRIGSKWGSEITDKALRALIIFLFVILAFISWRFEPKMGIASIIALLHDLIITAGIYSIVNFDVTPSTVIAILTILGYSLYDTVVVFDKVEEKVALMATSGRSTYNQAANAALNEVFMRSLNTSLSTLLPIGALLFVGAGLLGATTLEDLALALFVGILLGTYSSVFVATPVLSVMKERETKYRQIAERIERSDKRTQERRAGTPTRSVTEASALEDAEVSGTSAEPTGGVATTVTQSPVKRPTAGSKKAKRRRKR